MMTVCQAWKESLALECHQLYTCPYVSLLSCIMLIVLYLYLYLYLCLSVCVIALTYHAIQIFLWLKLLNWKTIQINFKFQKFSKSLVYYILATLDDTDMPSS